MADEWIQLLKNAPKTCIVQDGRRKIHFTLPDGVELAEEYDIRNNELIIRKWRRKNSFGRVKEWEYEVGEQLEVQKSLELEGLKENAENPNFVRKDTKDYFQWRIRNLPYPLETYCISVCNEVITVKTTNKKYYKKFGIPDMERLHLALDYSYLSLAHANNTLIISYKKPSTILELENKLLQEFKKIKATNDGDIDCTPS